MRRDHDDDAPPSPATPATASSVCKRAPSFSRGRPKCSDSTRSRPSTCPTWWPPRSPSLPANSQAFFAYTAIGQYDVQETALQNAMVAAGIANGGVLMTPHLMSSIHDSLGTLVESYTPKAAAIVATRTVAQQVTSLMEGVVASGTASAVGFPGCSATRSRRGRHRRARPSR